MAKVSVSSGTGFQPVNPWKSSDLTIQSRNLPHLQAPEATYFVTFRCCGPSTLAPQARALILSAVRHWDATRIDLDAAVIMPDHAHAIFRIIDGSSLSTILHSIKSFSSRLIDRLSRKGRVWLDESFDHIIRHEIELEEKADYSSKIQLKENWPLDPSTTAGCT